MGKVYNAPDEIKTPKLDFRNIAQYRKDCEQYKADLKEYLLKRNKAEYVGETIRFPVADGYAEYMVASLKPVELVHIPLWDAWDYGYAHRLTAKDIKEKINNQKKIDKLFGGNK